MPLAAAAKQGRFSSVSRVPPSRCGPILLPIRAPPSTILDPLLITPVEIAIAASRVAETHVSTQRRECVAAPPTLPGLRRLLPAMVTSQRSAIRAAVARPRPSPWLNGYRGVAVLAGSRLRSHPQTRQTDNYGKIFARLATTVRAGHPPEISPPYPAVSSSVTELSCVIGCAGRLGR